MVTMSTCRVEGGGRPGSGPRSDMEAQLGGAEQIKCWAVAGVSIFMAIILNIR